MEENDLHQDNCKRCPYCAEWIRKEAIKCRYCGSMLTERKFNSDFLSSPGYWHRVSEGKKIAGVCTGIAHQLGAPVLILPLRLFFILTIPFYGFGIILYVILWALMPPPVDEDRIAKSGSAGTGPKDFNYTEGSVPGSGTVNRREEPPAGQNVAENSIPGRNSTALVITLFYGLLIINAWAVTFSREFFPVQKEVSFALLMAMAVLPFLSLVRQTCRTTTPAHT